MSYIYEGGIVDSDQEGNMKQEEGKICKGTDNISGKVKRIPKDIYIKQIINDGPFSDREIMILENEISHVTSGKEDVCKKYVADVLSDSCECKTDLKDEVEVKKVCNICNGLLLLDGSTGKAFNPSNITMNTRLIKCECFEKEKEGKQVDSSKKEEECASEIKKPDDLLEAFEEIAKFVSKIKIENKEPISIIEHKELSEAVKELSKFVKKEESISIMEDIEKCLSKNLLKTDKNIASSVLSGVEEIEVSLGRLKTQKLSLDRRILMLEGVLKQYNLYIEENMEKIISSAMDAIETKQKQEDLTEIKQSSSEYKSGDIRKGTYNNNRTLIKHKEL